MFVYDRIYMIFELYVYILKIFIDINIYI